MGYAGKFAEKLKAQKLRRQGLSYKEILKHILVSKDTISRWCKEIELTQAQKNRLINNKISGQRKGSLVAADNKRKRRQERTQKIFLNAKKEIGELTQRDRFINGIALYAAEGTKSDRQGGFANSDPKLVNFMMQWFREFCSVPETRMRGVLWLHEGLNEEKAKSFWSNLTGIPIGQFHKTYRAQNKKDSKKIRKNIHKYGVFAIRFTHAEIHRQIMGWISALYDAKMSGIPR